MLLSTLTIRGRLLASLVVLGIGIIVLMSLSLTSQYNSLMDAKKIALKQNVEIAVSILDRYKNLVKDGNLSDEDGKKAAIEAIKNLRYNGKEYFWINDMTPKMVIPNFAIETTRHKNSLYFYLSNSE